MGYSGGGGLIQNSPSKTSDSSSSFLQGSQSTTDILTEIDSLSQSMVSDLFLLIELARFAAALQNFQERMQISMQCLVDAEKKLGFNLQITSWEFQNNDQQQANIFQQTEPYPGFDPTLQPNPNPNPGIIPNLWPGLNVTPQFTSPNPTSLQPGLSPNPYSPAFTPNWTPNLSPTFTPTLAPTWSSNPAIFTPSSPAISAPIFPPTPTWTSGFQPTGSMLLGGP